MVKEKNKNLNWKNLTHLKWRLNTNYIFYRSNWNNSLNALLSTARRKNGGFWKAKAVSVQGNVR